MHSPSAPWTFCGDSGMCRPALNRRPRPATLPRQASGCKGPIGAACSFIFIFCPFSRPPVPTERGFKWVISRWEGGFSVQCSAKAALAEVTASALLRFDALHTPIWRYSDPLLCRTCPAPSGWTGTMSGQTSLQPSLSS